MRNGKHYVQVRMTKSEKENFLKLSKLCNAPEKTVLYWLVNDMIVYEKPPETFFKITRLMLRLQINVDHICLSRYGLSEATKMKYHNFSKALNNYDSLVGLGKDDENSIPLSLGNSKRNPGKSQEEGVAL